MTTTEAVPDRHAATTAAFQSWAQAFGRYDDLRTIDALVGCANQIADDLEQFEVTVGAFEPGNATRYPIVVSRLTEVEAGSLGGQYCIALPRHRRCCVLTPIGLQTPDWIKEAFALTRDDDALLYAGLLSLLGDRLAD